MTPFTGHSHIDQMKGIVNWFVVSRDCGGKRLEHKGDRKIGVIMEMSYFDYCSDEVTSCVFHTSMIIH